MCGGARARERAIGKAAGNMYFLCFYLYGDEQRVREAHICVHMPATRVYNVGRAY